jgi:hypothetical protein
MVNLRVHFRVPSAKYSHQEGITAMVTNSAR